MKYPIGTKFYNQIGGDVKYWQITGYPDYPGYTVIGETKEGRHLITTSFRDDIFEENWRIEYPKEDLFDELYLRMTKQ